MIGCLTVWLEAQGDLLSISNRLVSFGPALAVAAALVFVWAKVSDGALFWVVAAAAVALAAIYYVAFFRVLTAQRERRYQRDVKPLLSSEYKNG